MTAPGGTRSYQELAAVCARLEADSGRHLVMQQDLIRAKDQVDGELMRFKAIQAYIAKALDAEGADEFFTLTLEAIIEAFEFEVALFLQATDSADTLSVASEFGFDRVPGTLGFLPEWFDSSESRVLGEDDPLIEAWAELGLAGAIVCPYHDKTGGFAGALLGGITRDSQDFYDPITDGHRPAFTVMVQQAGALWTNRQLNGEIRLHNEQLVNLTESYSRFVPFQFLNLLDRTSIEEINAGDHVSLEMSVLFADIRDFTTLSEELGPAGTFSSLNEFLVSVEPPIEREQGFINQYLGDAIMALFSGPADAALRCAAAMLAESRSLNERRGERGEMAICFGLGISSGPLMLGAIGGGGRLDSNVVGDTANLASRIEGLTKLYGVSALFTKLTRDRLEDPGAFEFRELDRVVVKGRTQAVSVYELLDGEPEAARARKVETRERFAEGLAHYRAGDFGPARAVFEDCSQRVPDDGAAAHYVRRCADLCENPPTEPWQGVWVIDAK